MALPTFPGCLCMEFHHHPHLSGGFLVKEKPSSSSLDSVASFLSLEPGISYRTQRQEHDMLHGQNQLQSLASHASESRCQEPQSIVQNVRKLCEEGRLNDAMNALDYLQQLGNKEKADAYVCLLQSCIKKNDLTSGKRIHSHISATGFKPRTFLGNTIINMYCKCGCLSDACKVFENMKERNVFTWTIMITGYVKHGYSKEAIHLFQEMEKHGLKPDRVTFISILNACASIEALEQGKQIHANIIKGGYESDITVGNSLIDMYAKCGSIEQAYGIFDRMPLRNVISWNTMISGYVRNGLDEEAVKLFRKMELGGTKPDVVTFVSILKAFANLAELEHGKKIHALIKKSKCEINVILGNALVDMYTKCGSIESARKVFEEMPERDVISWNTMIAGYGQNGNVKLALEFFWQIEREGIQPDEITYLSILRTCVSLGALEEGKQIHGHIIRTGFVLSSFLMNTLVEMYAKCGNLEDAHRVFHKLPRQEVISWNAMLSAYAEHGHSDLALELFEEMEQEGVEPNQTTFVNILKACAGLGALDQGKKVHARLIEMGLESDLFLASALIDMYSKFGDIACAREVFDRIPKRDVVLWTSMIAGYAQHGFSVEALELFHQMKHEGQEPDKILFATLLKACTNAAALEQGKRIHSYILESGFGADVFLGNSLLDMYAKCGSIEEARQVFDTMSKQDVVTWNALIAAYGQHGDGKEALHLAEQMIREGIKPDHITFVCVISACNHTGLVDEGCAYFNSMIKDHSLNVKNEHCACMVDILARAGRLEEAASYIKRLPFQPSSVVWVTLLGACRIHGNMELAKYASESILELKPENTAASVLLSNMYAASGKWGYKARQGT